MFKQTLCGIAFNDGKGVDGVVDGVAGGGVEEDGVCYSDL